MNKKEIDSIHPLVMAEEFWKNSQLSVARFYGRCLFNGNEYWIVNKDGKDLFQLSAQAERKGNSYAIMPGEPADLVLKELIPVYRWLGRDAFLDKIKQGVKASELLKQYKEAKEGGKKK